MPLADQLFEAPPSGLTRPCARRLGRRFVGSLKVFGVCRRWQIAQESRQLVTLEDHPRVEFAFRQQDVAKNAMCFRRESAIGDVRQRAEHVLHDARATWKPYKCRPVLRVAGKGVTFAQYLGDGRTLHGEKFLRRQSYMQTEASGVTAHFWGTNHKWTESGTPEALK